MERPAKVGIVVSSSEYSFKSMSSMDSRDSLRSSVVLPSLPSLDDAIELFLENFVEILMAKHLVSSRRGRKRKERKRIFCDLIEVEEKKNEGMLEWFSS